MLKLLLFPVDMLLVVVVMVGFDVNCDVGASEHADHDKIYEGVFKVKKKHLPGQKNGQ